MKILTWMLALTVCATGVAVAQGSDRSSTPVNRPNSSNFGWQDRQREAGEASDRYVAELKTMSEEQWKETALAMMAFESNAQGFSFAEVVRIRGTEADRKAVFREASNSSAEAPAWVVEFGKKKPKVLTLTLTDRAHTEVRCAADQLLEAGSGYVGVFQTDFELLCIARPAGSG